MVDSLYDLVILGGGCAGLSLAARLVDLDAGCPRTLVIESRPEYSNDRTWCFWDEPGGPLGPIVTGQWNQMKLRAGMREHTIRCGRTPYQLIAAADFYRAMAARIESSRVTAPGGIELRLGTGVTASPEKQGQAWRIETSGGVVHAKTVVDTRPASWPKRGGAALWQSFYGYEIECENEVFEPECVELMDFATSGPKGILFTYTVPISRTRALVEVTALSPDPYGEAGLRWDLAAAIGARTRGAQFSILRSESGMLPMGLEASAVGETDPTYVRVGVTAGGARPSTGYAFQRIQRWADECARRVGAGQLPCAHAPDPTVMRAMDFLFLKVLRARPELAPAVFVALFAKTETGALIRFLSDRANLGDYARVVAALPVMPFLEQVPGALRTWFAALAGRRKVVAGTSAV